MKKILLVLSLLIVVFLLYRLFQSLTPVTEKSGSPTPSDEATRQFKVKVLSIVYNPKISSESDLAAAFNWNSPKDLNAQISEVFKEVTQNRVIFNLVNTLEVADIPIKKDGFKYTTLSYLNCVGDNIKCHMPDTVNYTAIIDKFNLCERFNNGEFDEVWLWGGPYFGYWESTLAGSGAFNFNSFPVEGTLCKKPLPIMGFSYERGLAEAVHAFGHRMESTMAKVYGGWEQNRIKTDFDKFALVKVQSPKFDASGCGSIHFPPNAKSAYDYSDLDNVLSFCDEFPNNINDVNINKSIVINCKAWDCTQLGYLKYWFRHIPNLKGDEDGVLTDWFRYFAFPYTAWELHSTE